MYVSREFAHEKDVEADAQGPHIAPAHDLGSVCVLNCENAEWSLTSLERDCGPSRALERTRRARLSVAPFQNTLSTVRIGRDVLWKRDREIGRKSKMNTSIPSLLSLSLSLLYAEVARIRVERVFALEHLGGPEAVPIDSDPRHEA